MEGAHVMTGTNLFKTGKFKLASGLNTTWKIDCDALTDLDWASLAHIAMTNYGLRFGAVEGVPRGGIKLAQAMWPYREPGSDRLLICDDVWTTGESWNAHRAGRDAIGLVVFQRGVGRHPSVVSLFRMLGA